MNTPTAPLVSVVIPCRDAAETLPATLASVLAQTYGQIEVLVVDDGSRDDSAAQVRACRDDRVRLIQQPARGACAARNAGLAAARGGLVQFLDADDLLAPGKIAAQVALWRVQGNDSLYACGYTRFTTAPGDRTPQPRQPAPHGDPLHWIADCWLHGTMLPPHAWLVPLALCQQAGPWDESLLQNQDGEYFMRVLSAARQIHHLPERLCHYRFGRPGSISNQESLAARRSRLVSFDLCAAVLLARWPPARANPSVAALYMSLVVMCATDHPGLAEAAYAKALAHDRHPRITGRGQAYRTVAQLLGWRLAARLSRRLKPLTSRYRTG